MPCLYCTDVSVWGCLYRWEEDGAWGLFLGEGLFDDPAEPCGAGELASGAVEVFGLVWVESEGEDGFALGVGFAGHDTSLPVNLAWGHKPGRVDHMETRNRKPWRVSVRGLSDDFGSQRAAYERVQVITKTGRRVVVHHWENGGWVKYEVIEPSPGA